MLSKMVLTKSGFRDHEYFLFVLHSLILSSHISIYSDYVRPACGLTCHMSIITACRNTCATSVIAIHMVIKGRVRAHWDIFRTSRSLKLLIVQADA